MYLVATHGIIWKEKILLPESVRLSAAYTEFHTNYSLQFDVCRLRGGQRIRAGTRPQKYAELKRPDKVTELNENVGSHREGESDTETSESRSDQNEDQSGSGPGQQEADKILDKKLDAYAKKYGLSSGPPANPLNMILEKAAKSMDTRTKFKIKKERFGLQKKEIISIKKKLKDDDTRRKCRSV